MGKIFYADRSAYTTNVALKKILFDHYNYDGEILRSKNGKPYVENGPHFSVSHTDKRLFIAFSDDNVGLDAEPLSREIDYTPIVKIFSMAEQLEIDSNEKFLKHWIVRESAVKYLGGSLLHDLKSLSFENNLLVYQGTPFPTPLHFLAFDGHVLCVCAKEDFHSPTFIPIE